MRHFTKKEVLQKLAKKYSQALIFLPPYLLEYNLIEHTRSALKRKITGCVYLYGSISEALNAILQGADNYSFVLPIIPINIRIRQVIQKIFQSCGVGAFSAAAWRLKNFSPVTITNYLEIQAPPFILMLCHMLEILDCGRLNMRKKDTH